MLSFDKDIAQVFGLEEAILLEYLRKGFEKNVANELHFYDNRYWDFDSFKGICKNMPFWTDRKVKGIFTSLEKKGLISIGFYNQSKNDNYVWYSINQLQPEKEVEEEISEAEKIFNEVKSGRDKFIKPTLEEIKAYAEERGNIIDYQKFFDYYEASNWKDVTGKQVKNWKQKMITWEGRSYRKQEVPKPKVERKVSMEELKEKIELLRNDNFKDEQIKQMLHIEELP